MARNRSSNHSDELYSLAEALRDMQLRASMVRDNILEDIPPHKKNVFTEKMNGLVISLKLLGFDADVLKAFVDMVTTDMFVQDGNGVLRRPTGDQEYRMAQQRTLDSLGITMDGLINGGA